MNNYNLMVRGIIVNGDVPDAVQRVRQVRSTRGANATIPKPNKFVSISGKVMDTTPPGGMEFWARLATVINNNPVQEHDRFYMAMLKPLGIEKGKPFQPDARQTAILEEAAGLGDAMGRMSVRGTQRISGATPFPGTHWDWVIMVKPGQETENYSQLDERLHYTYGAIYTSPAIGVKKPGPGANYVQAFKDKDGNHFDGGKSYRLHVPANAPASAFWSLTLYDTATRSMVQNPTQRRGPLVATTSSRQTPTARSTSTSGPRRRRARRATGSRRFPARLLPDVPLLQPHRALVRRHMETAGRRADRRDGTAKDRRLK